MTVDPVPVERPCPALSLPGMSPVLPPHPPTVINPPTVTTSATVTTSVRRRRLHDAAVGLICQPYHPTTVRGGPSEGRHLRAGYDRCHGKTMVGTRVGVRSVGVRSGTGELQVVTHDMEAPFSDAGYRRRRMWTMQTEPAPIMCARPLRAPSTWRSPASPRSWMVVSQIWAKPVGPTG